MTEKLRALQALIEKWRHEADQRSDWTGIPPTMRAMANELESELSSALAGIARQDTEEEQMPNARVDGLPKPDQQSELPRLSPVCSEQGLPEPNLLATMDGSVWAKEFCRITGFHDEGWALAWFCNALMAGYDDATRRSDEAQWCQAHELWWSGPYTRCPVCAVVQPAAGIARQEAEHDFAHEISVMALVAASDPHLTAEQYRKALTGICNRAIAEKETLAGRVRASAQEQGRKENVKD